MLALTFRYFDLTYRYIMLCRKKYELNKNDKNDRLSSKIPVIALEFDGA